MLSDVFQGFPVFPVFMTVFSNKFLDYLAFQVIFTACTGIQVLVHETTAFDRAPGGPDIPAAIIVSQFAAFARMIG